MSQLSIIYEGSGTYGNYRIVDMVLEGRKSRVLYTDNNVIYSGVAFDDDDSLLFHYNQRFLEIAESIRPSSVLVIGGGTFTFPAALIERYPTISVDAVEIDPLLGRLAVEYFGLVSNERLNRIFDDGRQVLERTVKAYDYIVVDAFTAVDIPSNLIDESAATLYTETLGKNGVLAINVIAPLSGPGSDALTVLQERFRRHFDSVVFYQSGNGLSDETPQNIVLVATNNTETTLPYLDANEVATEQS